MVLAVSHLSDELPVLSLRLLLTFVPNWSKPVVRCDPNREDICQDYKYKFYHLQCKHCPKDYIGKSINPLRLLIENHRTTVFHKNINWPVSIYALEHQI